MMRHAILFVAVLLAACGAARPGSSQSLTVKSFSPLSGKEVFTYAKTVDGDSWAIVLSATNSQSKASHEVLKIANFDRGNVAIVENGKKAFFVIFSQNPEEVSDLWVADGIQGKAHPLFKSASSFSVSSDGRFICYEDLEKEIGEQSSFPIVALYDVKSLKVAKSNNYADEAFQDTVARISFDSKANVFRIDFVVEDRTMGTRTIEIP